jgi:hypothetical protein
VSATLVGLAPGTTYYYRLTASTGGSHGETVSFTTASPASFGPGPGSGTPPVTPAGPTNQPTTPTLDSAGTKPAATLQGSSVVVDTGSVANCPAGGPDCAVTTTATATVPTSALRIAKRRTKAVKIASASLKVRAGTSKRVTVKLNKTGVRLLRKLKKLSATLKISVRAGTGPPTVQSQKTTLRQPKKRRR